MTEISSPIVSEPNPQARGTCGKVRPGVDVRLVDENDCEVAVGTVGEMIVRTDRPWAMNSGYYKNAEATARAWRNGWFHTGDAFRMDADGNFFFVDRIKDAIRRRGENISSFEVEAEIVRFPAVREAAAVAVPSELGEDEVMAIVAPAPARRSTPPRCSIPARTARLFHDSTLRARAARTPQDAFGQGAEGRPAPTGDYPGYLGPRTGRYRDPSRQDRELKPWPRQSRRPGPAG